MESKYDYSLRLRKNKFDNSIVWASGGTNGSTFKDYYFNYFTTRAKQIDAEKSFFFLYTHLSKDGLRGHIGFDIKNAFPKFYKDKPALVKILNEELSRMYINLPEVEGFKKNNSDYAEPIKYNIAYTYQKSLESSTIMEDFTELFNMLIPHYDSFLTNLRIKSYL